MIIPTSRPVSIAAHARSRPPARRCRPWPALEKPVSRSSRICCGSVAALAGRRCAASSCLGLAASSSRLRHARTSITYIHCRTGRHRRSYPGCDGICACYRPRAGLSQGQWPAAFSTCLSPDQRLAAADRLARREPGLARAVLARPRQVGASRVSDRGTALADRRSGSRGNPRKLSNIRLARARLLSPTVPSMVMARWRHGSTVPSWGGHGPFTQNHGDPALPPHTPLNESINQPTNQEAEPRRATGTEGRDGKTTRKVDGRRRGSPANHEQPIRLAQQTHLQADAGADQLAQADAALWAAIPELLEAADAGHGQGVFAELDAVRSCYQPTRSEQRQARRLLRDYPVNRIVAALRTAVACYQPAPGQPARIRALDSRPVSPSFMLLWRRSSPRRRRGPRPPVLSMSRRSPAMPKISGMSIHGSTSAP